MAGSISVGWLDVSLLTFVNDHHFNGIKPMVRLGYVSINSSKKTLGYGLREHIVKSGYLIKIPKCCYNISIWAMHESMCKKTCNF